DEHLHPFLLGPAGGALWRAVGTLPVRHLPVTAAPVRLPIRLVLRLLTVRAVLPVRTFLRRVLVGLRHGRSFLWRAIGLPRRTVGYVRRRPVCAGWRPVRRSRRRGVRRHRGHIILPRAIIFAQAIVGRELCLLRRTSLVWRQRTVVGSGWHRAGIACVRLSAVIGRCASTALRRSRRLRAGLGRRSLIWRGL